MTSSNVSNLLVQVSSISVEMPDSKMDVSKNSDLFEKTLKNVAGPNVNLSSDPSKVPQTSNEKKVDVSKVNMNSKKEMVKEQPSKQPDEKEVVTKVEEAVNQVKEVIEEELDVNEEDIEKALEALGFTVIDLLNPQSLVEVVAQLSGEEDSIALVLSEEFKSILDVVTNVTSQLFDETKLNFQDVKDLFEKIDFDAEIASSVETPVVAEVEAEVNPEIKEEIPESKAEVKSDAPVVVDVKTDDTKVLNKEETVDDETPVVQIKSESNEKTGEQSEQFAGENSGEGPKPFKMEQKNPSEPILRTDTGFFAEARTAINFSPEVQVVTLPTGETVSAENIMEQVVEQARLLTDAESTTMELTLNPEGLGKIFMEVTQKGDEITAKIFTENDAVKQALEAQMANFRLEVNNSSTKVTSIEVSVGAHEFERNLEEDARNNERREEQFSREQKRSSRIDLNSLDGAAGLMSEEDLLIAQMMRDNGNTLDFQA